MTVTAEELFNLSRLINRNQTAAARVLAVIVNPSGFETVGIIIPESR